MSDNPSAVVAAERPKHGLVWSVRHLFAVLGTTVVLLARHLPVLLALIFAGMAGRRALIWAAVQLSDVNGFAGMLVFLMTPVPMALAVVLMLRAVSVSLPSRFTDESGPAGRKRRVLRHWASVIVPFAVVYTDFGFFAEDKRVYLYEVGRDEIFNNGDAYTSSPTDPFEYHPEAINIAERLPFDRVGTLFLILVAVLLLRMLLGLRAKELWHGLSMVRAYLEVTSVTVALLILRNVGYPLRDFAESRVSVHWAFHPEEYLPAPVLLAFDVLRGLVMDVQSVLIAPVAWLAMAAVVYGQYLGVTVLKGRALAGAVRRWRRVPGSLRSFARTATADGRDSLGPLLRVLRTLATTGRVPVLLYCVLFVALQLAGTGLFALERMIIGPGDRTLFWMPLSWVLGTFNDAVVLTLQIGLAAATVDRVLRLDRISALRRQPVVVVGVGGEVQPDGHGLGADRRGEVGDGLVHA
ncbi:hypothetical protein QEZ54_02475 [Catellatospora sp. KI3]|uniref:hypothetical protein n=1 Tax=Catellatospora sp. KI3 TaxID=3041620 RepID=UPI002482E204|nr:hypothetical protein [Catellatospora sp. KI3]MDI1459823.1 hypothetical protein [Catellatospora sp. KI3]